MHAPLGLLFLTSSEAPFLDVLSEDFLVFDFDFDPYFIFFFFLSFEILYLGLTLFENKLFYVNIL